MLYFRTTLGEALHADSLEVFRKLPSRSIDLIVTSPPFGLSSEKEYGNEPSDVYLKWFGPFATEFRRTLKNSGSLVIDLGGAWNVGSPTRSLYQFELLVSLCRDYGFFLAQEFFWHNPGKLPSPAQWVTINRSRVKDSVNCIWWLSPGKKPKADTRNVGIPYSASMVAQIKKGQREAKTRPSGHKVTSSLDRDNGSAIPSNLLSVAHTESNSQYLNKCRELNIAPHPARFPSKIPEFFIKYLTDEGDLVVDPFAGSCTTGMVCEGLKRRWICIDKIKDYLRGGRFRFDDGTLKLSERSVVNQVGENERKKKPRRIKTLEKDCAALSALLGD